MADKDDWQLKYQAEAEAHALAQQKWREEHVHLQRLVAQLSDALGGRAEDDRPPRTRTVDTVISLLDNLLEKVELPDTTTTELLAQRSRLSNNLDWEDLQQTLDDIHRLVNATIKRLRDEFSGFLHLLEGRLLEVREILEMPIGDATMLAGQLATALETVSALEEQSSAMRSLLQEERIRTTTDNLTQIANRVVWEERLAFEEARWQRYGHPVVICLVDIDGFKSVNDKHGVKVGDRVLQIIARALSANLRRTDFIARYGGEEFAVLLTDTHPDIALQVADGLRKRIASLVVDFDDIKIPDKLSISIGVAALSQSADAAAAFQLADRALHKAQESGGNRVMLADA